MVKGDTDPSAEDTETARRTALERQDALRYFQLCNDQGISRESIEDLSLYERGHADSSSRTSKAKSVSYQRPTNVNWESGLGKLVDQAIIDFEKGKPVQFKVVMNSQGGSGDGSYIVKGVYSYGDRTEEMFVGRFDARADADQEGPASCVSTLTKFLSEYDLKITGNVVTIFSRKG